MAIQIDSGIQIPARAALEANSLNVENLNIYFDRNRSKYGANVTVSFFAIADDKQVFARREDGSLVTETINVSDLYAKAATNQGVATAITAILDVVPDLYSEKKAADAARAAAQAALEAANQNN